MTPTKKNQVQQILSWLALAGVITASVIFLYTNFQTQAQAAVQEKSCNARYDSLKEILVEMKADIKEIRKEQRRESR